jgi:hypothetical protein
MKCLIYIAFTAGLFLTGCLKTEGILDIKGKVVDEKTKVLIPGRELIIQALIRTDTNMVSINVGQTSTDSSGFFTYSLRKVKDAYYYDFYLVGDSNYAFRTNTLGLMELEENAQFLTFQLRRLVDLSINISRKSKNPAFDTLYMSMESDGIDGRILFPYKLDNYGQKIDLGLCWIGGKVKSTVRTKAFADRRTKVDWELFRNGKKRVITDTITCRREAENSVNFGY